MLKIRQILCPVDFFPSSIEAAKTAVSLASRYNARLILLHVIEPVAPWVCEVPLETRKLIKETTVKSIEELRNLAKFAESAKVQAYVLVRAGLADLIIDSTIRTHNVDFVVMGTHGRRQIPKLFLGSTAEYFLRKLRVPLLTIRKVNGTKVTPFHHILVTTDLSEGTATAIAYAWSLAKSFGAKITLLHVLNDLQADLSGLYREQLIRGIQYELEHLLPAEARNKCSIRVLTGHPIRRILPVVEKEKVDLIVMNIHKKTAMDRLTIGSTAEKILRAAPVPVLAVPSAATMKRKTGQSRRAA